MNEEEWMLTSTNGRYRWSSILGNSVTPNQVMMTPIKLWLFNSCQFQLWNVGLIHILFIFFQFTTKWSWSLFSLWYFRLKFILNIHGIWYLDSLRLSGMEQHNWKWVITYGEETCLEINMRYRIWWCGWKMFPRRQMSLFQLPETYEKGIFIEAICQEKDRWPESKI